MPRTKPVDLTQPLVRHFFYRRHGRIAKGVIGLSDTQIDEKIKTGQLDPPVKAFDGGRASGWFGFQLIEIQEERLARAKAAGAVEATAKTPAPTGGAVPTDKRTKTSAKEVNAVP